jgi:type III pantothenate kinase
LILELDIGNTRCKWRLLDAAGAVGARGFGDLQHWLAGEFPPAWQSAIARVRVASVLAEPVEQSLSARLAAQWQVPVEWARTAASCAGVRNSYAEPWRLGVDRWLALIAAHRDCGGAALVVDIGSALTVDVVDRDGLHRGGYIIPGPRLMADVLLKATDRVRFEPSAALGGLELGQNTETCVSSGITAALAGAVVLGRGRAEALLAEPLALYIAGGYSAALAANLAPLGWSDMRLCPDLVLDGLRWVLP